MTMLNTSTATNAGAKRSNVNLDLTGLDLDGVHVIKKKLASGDFAFYFRHRKTDTPLPGLPGTADFENLRKQLDAGLRKQVVPGNTLTALYQRWTRSPQYDVAIGSDSRRRDHARTFDRFLATQVTDAVTGTLNPAFGETPLEHLMDDSFFHGVQAYCSLIAQERKAMGRTVREVDTQMGCINALFAWAVEQRILKAHPLGKYRKLYKSGRNDVIFNDDQITAWLKRAAQDKRLGRPLILVFLLGITTGQRASDLRELMWGDYIVMAGRRGFLIYPLKTQGHEGNKKVFVPVLPWVGDILDGMQGAADEKVLTMNGQPWTAKTLSFYFGNITRSALEPHDGNFSVAQTVPKDAKGLCARVESKNSKGQRVVKLVPLHMHDLRGTAITTLAEMNVADRAIASITGHSVEHVARILNTYVGNSALIAVGAIDALAKSPSMQRLEQQLAHLKPTKMLTYQPAANDELPEQLIPLQAAE